MNTIDRLLQLMVRLRDAEDGCPWDREQTFETIAPYTVEEAYEVADAIHRGDAEELAAELGDLLFQVVFHAQMAKEAGLFDFQDVVARVVEKMTRRHPHVFGGARIESVEAQSAAWDAHKAAERGAEPNSLMDEVTRGLPTIRRALKLQKKATRVAFDWSGPLAVLEKLREEVCEVEDEIRAANGAGTVHAEIGDLLFTCINLARHLDVDPDSALRGANIRFERRFRRMEELSAEEGKVLHDSSLDELDALWEKAKEEGL